MAMKGVINILVVCAFVFTMFRIGEAFDNYDCLEEKDLVMSKCMKTLRKEGDYVPQRTNVVKRCNIVTWFAFVIYSTLMMRSM